MPKIKISNKFKFYINQIKKKPAVSADIAIVNPNINKYEYNTIISSYWDAMLNKKRSKQAVSEVLGVVLLLGITVTLFTILNSNVSQSFFGTSIPLVNLVATIDQDQNNNTIYIQHNGGESLEATTEITITIGSYTTTYKTSDLLIDTNYNYKWNMGEALQFNCTDIGIPDITDVYIGVTVMDSNAILLSAVLQKGSI